MRTERSGLLISLVQRLFFSLEQFGRNEMANHAAAGAYAFLLSATPALLIIVYISSRIYIALDLDIQTVNAFLEPYLGSFGAVELTSAFLSRPMTGLAGILGALNLIWAARLFVVSIQRGIRVIYTDVAKTSLIRENLLTFLVELLLLFAVVLLITGSQVMLALTAVSSATAMPQVLGTLVVQGVRFLPALALWLFVFLTYHSIPKQAIRKRNALLSATLCVVLHSIVAMLLGLFLNTARYGVLYGIFGNLVGALLKVFLFFVLYYFFAELTFINESFDSLLLSRFVAVDADTRPVSRLERLIFANPRRLFRRFSKTLPAAQTIFCYGDESDEVLYLYSGSVAIYLQDPGAASPGGSSPEPVALIKEGEFFGEMAAVLGTTRTGWAVTLEPSVVFSISAPVFERFLTIAPSEARNVISLLAERLKSNHDQLRKAGQQ